MTAFENNRERLWGIEFIGLDRYIDNCVKPVRQTLFVLRPGVDDLAVRVSQFPATFDMDAPGPGAVKLHLEAAQGDLIELFAYEGLKWKV